MPFEAPIANALEAEYRALSPSRRHQALRKVWGREAALWLSGQARLRCKRVPAAVRKMLWIYSWTTVGDSIMDLAARSLVPASIEVDLCIAPALVPLFERDARFSRVYADPSACGGEYDFVLLDCLGTSILRQKRRYFPLLPFASLRGHLLGERFDRAAFGDHRVRQLFGLAPGAVAAPWLSIDVPEPACDVFRIAVALGARVGYKRYPQWPEVLAWLRTHWPKNAPSPVFRLMGQGAAAQEELRAIAADCLGRCCEIRIDSGGNLRDAALDLAACNAFLGVDGGLMHVAVRRRPARSRLVHEYRPALLPAAGKHDAGAAHRRSVGVAAGAGSRRTHDRTRDGSAGSLGQCFMLGAT